MEFETLDRYNNTGKYFCDRCHYQFNNERDLKKHKMKKMGCGKAEIKIENKIENPNEIFKGSAKEDLPSFDIEKLVSADLEGGFAALLSASRRSGKTNLLKYIYSELKKQFDIIVFFSDTLHNKKYSFVEEPKFNKFDPGVIVNLFEFQKETDNTFRILIIMDDCVSNQTRESNEIMQLYLTGRNWNISCIISTQVSTLINKKVRGNTDFVFIGKTNTPENRLNLIDTFLISCVKPPEQITTKVGKEDYLDKYIVDNTTDYNFLVLDYLNDGERVFNYKAPKVL